MNNGTTALPYSHEGLLALAETLKIHQSFLWIDPVTQAVKVKELGDSQARSAASQQ